jgi:hypothetical protein
MRAIWTWNLPPLEGIMAYPEALPSGRAGSVERGRPVLQGCGRPIASGWGWGVRRRVGETQESGAGRSVRRCGDRSCGRPRQGVGMCQVGFEEAAVGRWASREPSRSGFGSPLGENGGERRTWEEGVGGAPFGKSGRKAGLGRRIREWRRPGEADEACQNEHRQKGVLPPHGNMPLKEPRGRHRTTPPTRTVAEI